MSVTSIVSRMLQSLYPRSKDYRGMFLGNDASGKTTILYMLKLGEVVTTIPTIGFNVETIEYKGMNLTLWDVGGCDKIRPLWRHYYQVMNPNLYIIPFRMYIIYLIIFREQILLFL